MKLVVPGGNGFIGTEICRIAVQNGHDVAALGAWLLHRWRRS